MPRKPERVEVRAPSKKAMVLKIAFTRAGLHIIPVLYVQGSCLVLKPLTEPWKRKMMVLNTPMTTLRYLYCGNKNDVAPENKADIRKYQ